MICLKEVDRFHWHIKYSSKLLSRQAFGFMRDTFLNTCLSGIIKSCTSSHTNTFNTRFPLSLSHILATSSIARLSSTDRY